MPDASRSTFGFNTIYDHLGRLLECKKRSHGKREMRSATQLLGDIKAVIPLRVLNDFARIVKEAYPKLMALSLHKAVHRFAAKLHSQTVRTLRAVRFLGRQINKLISHAISSSSESRWRCITDLTDLLNRNASFLPFGMISSALESADKLERMEKSEFTLAAILELRNEAQQILETDFDLID